MLGEAGELAAELLDRLPGSAFEAFWLPGEMGDVLQDLATVEHLAGLFADNLKGHLPITKGAQR